MGKVKIPEKSSFLKKISIALLILVVMVIFADVGLRLTGLKQDTLLKAIGIVTDVGIVNEDISFKYFFTFLAILGGVVQFYLIYVVLEYLLEGKFQNIFTGVRHMNKVKSMKGHFIVAGGGRVGSHAAKMLKKYGKEVVIIDKREDVIEKLRKEGFIAVKGDVLDENFLKEINIEKASFLIACLGSDSDNILLVLTARELHPGLKISARANNESVKAKLEHAGASHVVVPSSLGGDELAKSAVRRD